MISFIGKASVIGLFVKKKDPEIIWDSLGRYNFAIPNSIAWTNKTVLNPQESQQFEKCTKMNLEPF